MVMLLSGWEQGQPVLHALLQGNMMSFFQPLVTLAMHDCSIVDMPISNCSIVSLKTAAMHFPHPYKLKNLSINVRSNLYS